MSFDQNDLYEPARGFISYARQDNVAMNGVADELRSRIQNLYQAKTGRSLEIFIDRESIGWGEDWRSSIRDAVGAATIFIPLITMNYFARPACRQELMAFYESASLLGVTDLILPIVLAGADGLSADDPREEVRLIERLNYRNLSRVWPRGFTSPEWLTEMDTITDYLVAAVRRTEQSLSRREVGEPVQVGSSRRPDEVPDNNGPSNDDDSHDNDLVSAIIDFKPEVDAMTVAANVALEDLNEFAEEFADAVKGMGAQPTLADIQKLAPVLAKRISQPAVKLGDSGAEFGLRANRVDAIIRRIQADLSEVDLPELHESFNSGFRPLKQSRGFESISSVLAMSEQMFQYMRLFQRMSVSLRNVMTPALKGIASIRDGIQLTQAWGDIEIS